MEGMFYGAKKFKQDLSKWDVKNVVYCTETFKASPMDKCPKKQPIFNI